MRVFLTGILISTLMGCGGESVLDGQGSAPGSGEGEEIREKPIANVVEDLDRDGVPDHLGEFVHLHGRAAASSDALFPERLYLFLQDSTAGVLVFDFGAPQAVAEGDSVEVSGTVSQYNGMTQIVPSSFRVVPGLPRSPRIQDLTRVARIDLEAMEGRLVRVRGRVLQRGENDGGGYLRLELEDRPGTRLEVFVRNVAHHAGTLAKYEAGDRLEVTGLMGQFDTFEPYFESYQIYPRGPGDIRILRPAASLLMTAGIALAAIGLLGLLWSLSLRRQVKTRTRQLAESEVRYRTLLESGPSPVLVLSGEVILYANAQAGGLLGWSVGAGSGPERLSEVLAPASVEALLAREPGEGEEDPEHPGGWMGHPIALDRLDGVSLEVEVSSGRVSYMGAEATQLWLQDVTARQEAERTRRRLEARLLEAARMESIGVLAGGVAHEFNNLLTTVLGNADLISEDLAEDSPHLPLMGEIADSAIRATRLTQALLAYTGRGKLALESVDLADLVRGTEPLLRSGTSRKATLELDLLGVTVRLDEQRMKQVILNLVTNASEALEGGEGTITVRTRPCALDGREIGDLLLGAELPPGAYGLLEVEDTGVGIEEGTRDRVFDPFFSTKFTGRGLGLASVWGIVEAHHGGLGLASEPGVGSCFRVFLPLGE